MSIKLIFASTAALAMIAATPAFAARNQGQNPQAEASESGGGAGAAKVERKTCRTFDSTESRMKRTRLCLDREGWKKFEAEQSE